MLEEVCSTSLFPQRTLSPGPASDPNGDPLADSFDSEATEMATYDFYQMSDEEATRARAKQAAWQARMTAREEERMKEKDTVDLSETQRDLGSYFPENQEGADSFVERLYLRQET